VWLALCRMRRAQNVAPGHKGIVAMARAHAHRHCVGGFSPRALLLGVWCRVASGIKQGEARGLQAGEGYECG